MARKKIAKKIKRAKKEKAIKERAKKIDEKGEDGKVEEVEEELEEEEDEEMVEGATLELPKYKASPKPVLSNDVKKALKLRKEKKKNQPHFLRQEAHRYVKLPNNWRKPRGIHSKMRLHKGYRSNVVSIGYRGPKKARGLHPSGFKEVLVHNVKDAEGVDPKTEAIRIASGVGTKKREAIEERVAQLEKKNDVNYYILNPLRRYDVVAVFQPSDLDDIARQEQAVYIPPIVGKKQKAAIIAKAKEMADTKKGGVKILNVKEEPMD